MTSSRLAYAALLSSAVVLSPALSTAASAGDYYGAGGDPIYSFVTVSGGDFAKDAAEGYLGLFYALNRNLDSDGFIIRVLGTRGFYDYDVAGVEIDAKYWQGDVMLGYQWVRGGIDVGVYLGVDFQDHDLSPDDPFNKLRGSETGFKVAFDLESNGNSGSPLYMALRASYSTAFDTYYSIGRIGYDFGRVTIGPEVWLLGDASGDAQRVGGFIMFDDLFGAMPAGNISFSGGYQFTDEGANGKGFGEEGAYATVKFRMAFGREDRAAPLK